MIGILHAGYQQVTILFNISIFWRPSHPEVFLLCSLKILGLAWTCEETKCECMGKPFIAPMCTLDIPLGIHAFSTCLQGKVLNPGKAPTHDSECFWNIPGSKSLGGANNAAQFFAMSQVMVSQSTDMRVGWLAGAVLLLPILYNCGRRFSEEAANLGPSYKKKGREACPRREWVCEWKEW